MTKEGINPHRENPPPDSRASSFIPRLLGINPHRENPPPDSPDSSFIRRRLGINSWRENPLLDSRDSSSVHTRLGGINILPEWSLSSVKEKSNPVDKSNESVEPLTRVSR